MIPFFQHHFDHCEVIMKTRQNDRNKGYQKQSQTADTAAIQLQCGESHLTIEIPQTR